MNKFKVVCKDTPNQDEYIIAATDEAALELFHRDAGRQHPNRKTEITDNMVTIWSYDDERGCWRVKVTSDFEYMSRIEIVDGIIVLYDELTRVTGHYGAEYEVYVIKEE